MPPFGLEESFGTHEDDTTWAELPWIEMLEEPALYAQQQVTLHQREGFQKPREKRWMERGSHGGVPQPQRFGGGRSGPPGKLKHTGPAQRWPAREDEAMGAGILIKPRQPQALEEGGSLFLQS